MTPQGRKAKPLEESIADIQNSLVVAESRCDKRKVKALKCILNRFLKMQKAPKKSLKT